MQDYFFDIISANKLEKIIDNLINKVTRDNNIRKIMEMLFVNSAIFHDFGKVNPEFQKKKMKNNTVKKLSHSLSSAHSIISAYIFILISELTIQNNFIDTNKINKNDEDKICAIDYLVLTFSLPILKHHSPNLDNLCNMRYSSDTKDLRKFVNFFNSINEDDPLIKVINESLLVDDEFLINGYKFIEDSFSLFLLIKLNYSILTAADYYATTHFMSNWKRRYFDFGTLTKDFKNKIISNICSTKEYNKKIYNELENYSLYFPNDKSNNTLNKLRQNLAVEVINGIRSSNGKSVFYIEAPTGSGKTNLSLIALAELLRKDTKDEITKIFYVFPFTTLITQTYDVVMDTLGLDKCDIAQIHHKSSFSDKDDDQYGKQRDPFIDYQFANYPITLMSHVRFFEIMKSEKKKYNYLLNRLANSIVIIDELQAYPSKEWDKVAYFIDKLSKLFNIKFILMSATLPKLDGLIIENSKVSKFVNLIKNKQRYFSHPVFKDRVKFDFSMLENKSLSLDDLFKFVKSESKKYANYHGSVHAVVEFIFKSSAGEFMNIAVKNNGFFDEIFILSGEILESRRREVIENIKGGKLRNANLLLITTQVIEAGVDIDMDIGFKDRSLIDSEEQLAGRINRNLKKNDAKLYIFKVDNENTIYGKDERVRLSQDDDLYKSILLTKDFDLLYNKVIDMKNIHNLQKAYVDTMEEYVERIRKLSFHLVDREFKIIGNNIINVSLFLPILLPSCSFNNKEITFMEDNGLSISNYVDGKEIFELFEKFITNKDKMHFTLERKTMAMIFGIISQFTITLAINSNRLKSLRNNGNIEERHGYFYLHNPEEVYDYKIGFKNIAEEETIFW